jgi:hypothetical protein
VLLKSNEFNWTWKAWTDSSSTWSTRSTLRQCHWQSKGSPNVRHFWQQPMLPCLCDWIQSLNPASQSKCLSTLKINILFFLKCKAAKAYNNFHILIVIKESNIIKIQLFNELVTCSTIHEKNFY